jgi:hypothetical protein
MCGEGGDGDVRVERLSKKAMHDTTPTCSSICSAIIRHLSAHTCGTDK